MEKLSKAKQGFLYAAPFPALVVFQVWAASGRASADLLMAAFSMLAYCAVTLTIARRWDKPTYFDWAAAAYFAFVSGALLLWPEGAGRLVSRYAVTGIYACLFAAAFFPPLLGKDPFTYHYAKRSTPPEAWGTSVFFQINRIMTSVWSGIFAVCALLSLHPSVFTRTFIPIGLMLGFGLPFNLRFPDLYLKRLGLPSLAEQRRGALRRADSPSSGASDPPLPSSAWEAVSHMPDVFNKEAAGNLSAVVGFVVSGAESFEAYLHMEEGACRLENQPLRKPDLLIRAPAEVWLGIARKEIDGQEAFMRQAFTAEGDLGLLARMKDLFSNAPSGRANSFSSPSPSVAGSDQPLFSKKENAMKVLALNSSPRGGGQSKTELMLNHLVQGMREAGADVEVIALRDKKVKNCVGCYACWTKTPGVCIHNDDMTNELYPKWLEADLAVYGTPLYHFTVNAAMKAFIERTLPILEPLFELHGERTRHPLRHRHPAVAMLSVAGFPEDAVFDQLSSWANFIFRPILAAEIYRPFAEGLTLPAFAEKSKEILAAVTQAGRELVESKKVAPQTLARIKQPIADRSAVQKMVNLMWKTCLAEGVTPKELKEKRLIPRPDSLEAFMTTLKMGFDPDGAGDARVVLQFRFSGEVEGSCHFKIDNGGIEAFAGDAERPDLTIDAPFDLWMDVVTGKADGRQMYMAQQYKVNGDLSLLMRMNSFFRR